MGLHVLSLKGGSLLTTIVFACAATTLNEVEALWVFQQFRIYDLCFRVFCFFCRLTTFDEIPDEFSLMAFVLVFELQSRALIAFQLAPPFPVDLSHVILIRAQIDLNVKKMVPIVNFAFRPDDLMEWYHIMPFFFNPYPSWVISKHSRSHQFR